jgi:hypothetical protein
LRWPLCHVLTCGVAEGAQSGHSAPFAYSHRSVYGDKLARLVECGLTLSEGVAPDEVTARLDEFASHFGDAPSQYAQWLGVLGAMGEGRSPDVASIDPECDADYPAIIAELNRLAGEELVRVVAWSGMVEDDEVPLTVTVELPGATHATWQFENQGDWIDIAVIAKFAAVLASASPRRMYEVEIGDDEWSDDWVPNLMAQNLLIVSCEPSIRDAVAAATPLHLVAV